MSPESYKHAGDIFTTLHLVTAPGEIIDGSILIKETSNVYIMRYNQTEGLEFLRPLRERT